MKLISYQEYDNLMSFMQPKLKALWEHENSERPEERQLHAFQFGFSIMDIFHYRFDEDRGFYMVFNGAFLHLINEGILEAVEKYPDLFGTGDARDVLQALYNVSAFESLGAIDEYEHFLIDHPCCYIVYHNGANFEEDILRIDVFRLIQPSQVVEGVDDFIGGLMHTLKHFSIDDKFLSTSQYKHNVFDIHHIIYLIAMAFRLRTGEGTKYKAIQDLSEERMLASFYREEETGIFFLNSYYKKSGR